MAVVEVAGVGLDWEAVVAVQVVAAAGRGAEARGTAWLES
jgi:hypothetical protein